MTTTLAVERCAVCGT